MCVSKYIYIFFLQSLIYYRVEHRPALGLHPWEPAVALPVRTVAHSVVGHCVSHVCVYIGLGVCVCVSVRVCVCVCVCVCIGVFVSVQCTLYTYQQLGSGQFKDVKKDSHISHRRVAFGAGCLNFILSLFVRQNFIGLQDHIFIHHSDELTRLLFNVNVDVYAEDS